jgi:hypothetical protein
MMSGAPPFRLQSQVTLANWQDPPFNRWAFQHVRELIPTVRISRGSGPPWRLPSDDRDIAEVRFRHDDRELSIADLLADTYTDGFLVVCVPKTLSRSCDQAVLVDQASGVGPPSDAVPAEIDRSGQGFQRRSGVQ